MPRFFADMPPAKPGLWIASVEIVSPWKRTEIWRKPIVGLRRAYTMARLRALVADFTWPSCDGELGIDWRIEKAP